MKRHESLIPLTHDHHHALAQARRLREAASGTQGERRMLANDFVNFYFGRAVRHFHEEEELFFAAVVDEPEAQPLVTGAMLDHLRLHALVRRLARGLRQGATEDGLLEEIAQLLTTHVHLEEKELFPLLERLIPEDDLVDLATRGRRDV